jgi:HK97 family phage portal protein
MGILDIFNKKEPKTTKNEVVTNESNTMFGQTQLGNNVVYQGQAGKQTVSQQLLYVTTSSATTAGRPVDMTMLSRNSTVMACVGVKARTLAQLPKCVYYKTDDGEFVEALKAPNVGKRDKDRARQVQNLLYNPNNFQSSYEFWYQWSMWLDLAGETFTLWWRENPKDAISVPLEMYNLDSSLMTCQLTPSRYPKYVLSTPSYGFNKDEPLSAHQVMHIMEAAWQGSAGFNKGILATELVALDQDIDLYANFIMQNGAKPSGMFVTDQILPDAKYKELAARIKEAWSSMVGSRTTDLSKAGQGMLLEGSMKYEPIDMLTLQDADCAALKEQTMKRICGLFGVPPQMISVGEGKFNNTQTMLDEFHKTTMYPLVINIEQKLNNHLLKGYPNLCVRFDTKEFLKGAALDQMNFVTAGVSAGIITPNEARQYLNMAKIDGADELGAKSQVADPIAGSSPQDTGGGGGNQTKKMNIGTK